MSGLTGSPLLRPAELLASLTETFTSGLSTVRSPPPVAGYNYGGNWTIPPAGLPPAGSAASVAAQVPRFHHRSLVACRSLRPRRAQPLHISSSFVACAGLRRRATGSALSMLPISGLTD